MGIIIVLYLLPAIIIVLFSLKIISMHYTEMILNSNNILYGIILTFLIYAAIELAHETKKEIRGLKSLFIYPLLMIYFPFIIAVLTKSNLGFDNKSLSDFLFVSIVISALFLIVSSIKPSSIKPKECEINRFRI